MPGDNWHLGRQSPLQLSPVRKTQFSQLSGAMQLIQILLTLSNSFLLIYNLLRRAVNYSTPETKSFTAS